VFPLDAGGEGEKKKKEDRPSRPTSSLLPVSITLKEREKGKKRKKGEGGGGGEMRTDLCCLFYSFLPGEKREGAEHTTRTAIDSVSQLSLRRSPLGKRGMEERKKGEGEKRREESSPEERVGNLRCKRLGKWHRQRHEPKEKRKRLFFGGVIRAAEYDAKGEREFTTET